MDEFKHESPPGATPPMETTTQGQTLPEGQPATKYLGNLRQGAGEVLLPAAEKQFLRQVLADQEQREWDVHSAETRFTKRLERLHTDPAEQRRIDQIVEEIPPDRPPSGPVAKDSLSQPDGMDRVDSPEICNPLAKDEANRITYNAVDTLRSLYERQAHLDSLQTIAEMTLRANIEAVIYKRPAKDFDDDLVVKATPKSKFGKDEIGSEDLFGKGKTVK
jgi:hypothetical protein